MKTIKQAIIDEISYPLGEGLIDNKIISRGLDGDAEYNFETANSSEFKGAVADCLYALIDAPSFSEADLHITLSDKEMILRKANSLYKSIGEDAVGIDEPMVYIE